MSVKATLLLGVFLLLAALAHGGLYSAGQDFVVNRFTGRYEFVPAEGEDEASLPVRSTRVRRCALTGRRPGARVPVVEPQGAWRDVSTGR